MTARIKLLAAASVLSVAALAPASADYSILEDSTLPSVVFVEFEGEVAEPSVIDAPTPSVSSGGSHSSSSSAAPAMPSAYSMRTSAKSSTILAESGIWVQTSGPLA